MKIVSLSSGSDGNCTLVSTKKCNILIDCGIAAKRIKESLENLGLSIYDINAVFLTHEHIDHIKGLKRLVKAYKIHAYGSHGTLAFVRESENDGFFKFGGAPNLHEIRPDDKILFGNMEIIPFSIFHDALEPFGYRINISDDFSDESDTACKSVCVMTDCGHIDDYIAGHLMGLSAILIEANHDRSMLANGNYPLNLKRRIMSLNGHMSNVTAGNVLAEIYSPSLKGIILGHLSKENNTLEIAENTVKDILKSQIGEDAASSIKIFAAPHNAMSEIIEI